MILLTNDAANQAAAAAAPPPQPPPQHTHLPTPTPPTSPPPPPYRYADRLPNKPIILLTNDAANRAAAAAAGLTAMSLSSYSRSRKDVPELIDLVARQVSGG
jgi:hypothetical protein